MTREANAGLERYLDRLSFEDDSACGLAEPNFDTNHFPSSFYPRESKPRQIEVEARLGEEAIRELRKAFRQAGHSVWGQVRFIVRSDGSFNAEWGYEGCDANGDLPFDEEAELRRREAERLRLVAGRPRQA